MMGGRLYIDGRDVYTEFGVYVVEGGWNELLSYPPLKPVVYNDWQEEDGIEVDLSDPILDSQEVFIKIAISEYNNCFESLIKLLSDRAYHIFDCAYIQRRYKLRLIEIPSLTTTESFGIFTLKLANDFPLMDYTYLPPFSGLSQNEDYGFDGALFSDYGVYILKGVGDELGKTSSVKMNLLRNINTEATCLYDDNRVTFKSKEVNLDCLMRADSLNALWRNYDALLFDLTRPAERLLEIEGEEYPFYYKSCRVSEFYPTDKIWLQFTLTIVFTTNVRVVAGDFILASESQVVITTENGDFAILL